MLAKFALMICYICHLPAGATIWPLETNLSARAPAPACRGLPHRQWCQCTIVYEKSYQNLNPFDG